MLTIVKIFHLTYTLVCYRNDLLKFNGLSTYY